MLPLLAQDSTAQVVVDATRSLWVAVLDNAFALTILFIFLTAIVTVFVQQRRKDKCLKLLHDHHVSIIRTDGSLAWGDLTVFPKGLRLDFDAAYVTQRGLVKTGSILYEPDIDNCLALCRCVDALTEREQHARRKQIQRSFQPNLFRRMLRGARNVLNTLRDAFAKALSAVIGQLARARPGNVMTQQQAGVEQIGTTLLGAAANAYEPVLEPHIGKPVVLELTTPNVDGKPGPRIDVPGYLVDYTDRFVAIFNVQHDPIETVTVDAAQPFAGSGFTVERNDTRVVVRCTGPDLVVVRSLATARRTSALHVALCTGCRLELPHDDSPSCSVEIQRTRRIDLVCPRKFAVVRYAGERGTKKDTPGRGVAPEAQLESTA